MLDHAGIYVVGSGLVSPFVPKLVIRPVFIFVLAVGKKLRSVRRHWAILGVSFRFQGLQIHHGAQ